MARRASAKILRVNKVGPNCGRIFASCHGCDFFEWLTDPDPANAPPEPTAEKGSADEVLEALRSKAGDCPVCGKPRTANRVRKEGPNTGRLFYSCSDRECSHFEWASPAPASAVPDDPELAQARQETGPCEGCGAARSVNRVKKEGANKGRLFAKCDACGAFDWVSG